MPFHPFQLSVILSLKLLIAESVFAQVSSSFPYIYLGDSGTTVILNDLAIAEDGGVIGVGYVDYSSDTTATVFWTRSLIVKFSPQGELLWEKIHRIGGYFYNGTFHSYSKFKCILQFEGDFLVAGESHADGVIGSRISLCRINHQGDTLWCKNYGLPPRNSYLYRMMLHNGEVVISGSIHSPATSIYPFGFDGLLIRTTTDGNLIDIETREPHNDSTYHSFLSFRGMDIDGMGQLRVIGHSVKHQVSTGVGHHHLQLFDLENENISLVLNDSLTNWRPPNDWSGAVSEGHRSYSDTTVIYGYNTYPNYGAIRAKATASGVNYTVLNSDLLPPGYVVYYVCGAVRYGDMDFIYGNSWSQSTLDSRLFALAVHRESSQPVWCFQSSDSTAIWGETPIILDSINGIAWLSAFDEWDSELPFTDNTIYRFDLSRIYPFLLSTESHESEDEINVWPNPFDDQLQLQLPSFGATHSLTITDMQGRQLLSQQIMDGQLSVGTGHLPAGLYTVTVADDAGRAVSQRMVKLNR